MASVFILQLVSGQGVGTSQATDIFGGSRWTIQLVPSAGFDRQVVIEASLDGVTYVSLEAHITPNLSATQLWGKFEGVFRSVRVTVQGGTTGTVDVWLGSNN